MSARPLVHPSATEPTIAVVGSGRMGSALVRLLAAHRPVMWSSREPRSLAGRIEGQHLAPQVRAVDHEGAVAADVVVLAMWHRDAMTFARQHAEALAGKVVVDLANPFTDDFNDFFLPEHTSAAEELARSVPDSKVVGAFKTTFWAVLEDPDFPDGPADVLVTGDDPDAKTQVIDLLAVLPFRFLDAGPLARNRVIERMTLLSREVAMRYDHYPRVTWRLLGARA